MMRKLLEAMTKFAGEPEQKPGEQWKGTDKGTPGKKLVGDSIIKDLVKGPTPKTKEEELAEAYANFMEDDIGVEPKRPGRKSDRPAREYTKHGKPSKRYTTVEEGWNTGNNRVSLPDTPHTYWSGTGALQKEYDALYDALVPSQGKADTIEGEVLRASSKIVYRHYNDGDEFNEASFDQLTPYIGTVTGYDDLAHKAIEFALKANGNYTPNPDWDSLDVMDYGPAEDDYEDEDEEDDDSWDHDDDEDLLGEGMEEFAKSQAKQRAEKRKSIPWPKEVPTDAEQERDRTRDEEENDPHPYADTPDLDEGATDVYSITSERNGRERSKSGTLAELIEYYSYTLETGKSYEHERGNRKINLNPKSIESLVQNLNNAKDNAAANGSSNERFYVDHSNMAEGRGPSKGLHKKVTIVKGRDAGKTGYVRQIKTDKLRNRVYLDLDLEDGGQAVVLKQDVRLVKDLAENYTGRETKDGVWRVFKDGQGGSVAGPFKSAEEANAWIKKQNQGVVEARTTWNNDFYVYDPETKTVKKKFRTHRGAKQYAEANGLAVASAEYYHDSVSKEVNEHGDQEGYEPWGSQDLKPGQKAIQGKPVKDTKKFTKDLAKDLGKQFSQEPKVKEGWESGPEERTRVERDPDAEYDARRQEKLDAPYAQKEPEAKGYHVVSLDTRQPVTDKVFPTKGHAMAYIQSNYGKNLAYRAINEGIESGDPVESAVLSAVQELIQQGHTEVAPEVITNMVVAATSQPFLLKDLVDCNNNSPAIQHYVDSINPTKVKFSNEILTVKNEDPAKDKKQAQAGVSSMAARAASRNRLGETKAISELSTDLVTKVGTARAQQLAPHVASNSTSPDRLKFAIKKNKAVDNLLAKSRAANEIGDTASAQHAVAGVRKIKDTVDGISEGSETPLRDTEDYRAKRSALQQIQMDLDTHKDPQLKAELTRRLGSLNQQYADLQSKLREFKESRGHKVIATKLGNMDRMNNVQIPTPAERQEQIRLRKEKEAGKKPVKEFAVPGAATVATATPGAKPADPAAVAKAAAATNTLKAATGTTVAPATLDKALDSATQGTATSTDVKALAPIMGVLNKAAADPKLATQFKTIANQAKLTP
jgi:hypothetical protein